MRNSGNAIPSIFMFGSWHQSWEGQSWRSISRVFKSAREAWQQLNRNSELNLKLSVNGS